MFVLAHGANINIRHKTRQGTCFQANFRNMMVSNWKKKMQFQINAMGQNNFAVAI